VPTKKNVQAVAELEEDFRSSALIIAAEYRGLDVGAMQGMRRAVRQSDSQFKVAKNTLARIAADNSGRSELKEFIDGPIGFLTTQGDPATAAKVLVNYIDDNSIEMTIVGGALDSEVLTADRVKALAKLPPKEVLLAQLLGGMNGPITNMVRVMNGPVRALAIVLQRISEQISDAAVPAETLADEPAPEAETTKAETDAAPAAATDAAEATESEIAEDSPADSPESAESAESPDPETAAPSAESGKEKTE
jgi:large subunit ribosomal protein L10